MTMMWIDGTNAMLAMCNCGAMAVTANAMGYPPSHGADCPMCPPNERWLKKRIRELEARLAAVEPPK